jgi:hypothetical protein
MQLLWHFQQLIGSYMASFVGDGKASERWSAGADSTANGFNAMFVDTTAKLVYDYLSPDGAGSLELRPNAILCLEIIGSELIQQTTLKRILSGVVYPHGVGTLDPGDKRYSAFASDSRIGLANGPVATWLAGQLTYALTRYDRQDIAFTVTARMVDQILDAGVAGALPEAFDVVPREANAREGTAGLYPSTVGMSELVRSFYQDYLGVRVDAPSRVLAIQPKLPEHLTDADFTVLMGTQPIRILYRVGRGEGDIFVEAPGAAAAITLNVLWVLDGGDAWRGSMRVRGGQPMHIGMNGDDMLATQGGQNMDITGKWKIRNFSRRNEFGGFTLARPMKEKR